jgi:hypothetical protein
LVDLATLAPAAFVVAPAAVCERPVLLGAGAVLAAEPESLAAALGVFSAGALGDLEVPAPVATAPLADAEAPAAFLLGALSCPPTCFGAALRAGAGLCLADEFAAVVGLVVVAIGFGVLLSRGRVPDDTAGGRREPRTLTSTAERSARITTGRPPSFRGLRSLVGFFGPNRPTFVLDSS